MAKIKKIVRYIVIQLKVENVKKRKESRMKHLRGGSTNPP